MPYQYDEQGAKDAGETRDPELVIRELFDDARIDRTGGDWVITGSPKPGLELPAFVVRLGLEVPILGNKTRNPASRS